MFLLYLVWILGINDVMNALEFDQMRDGIIVSHGKNIGIIEGEWTLLLTIHEDGVDHRMVTHLELVGRARELWAGVINGQSLSTFFTEQQKALMRAKVDLVVGAHRELRYNLTTRRDRRGVLDFVGNGLNWAFGTAMQSQGSIDKLQHAMDTARASQHAVVHNVQELITVVNQTQMQGEDTRLKLAMLSRTYDLFVKSEGDRWKRYDENTKLLMMEEYIDIYRQQRECTRFTYQNWIQRVLWETCRRTLKITLL